MDSIEIWIGVVNIFTITRITLSYTLPNTNLISNIYLALSIAWVVEATILMLAFYLGFWKKAWYQEKKLRDWLLVF